MSATQMDLTFSSLACNWTEVCHSNRSSAGFDFLRMVRRPRTPRKRCVGLLYRHGCDIELIFHSFGCPWLVLVVQSSFPLFAVSSNT